MTTAPTFAISPTTNGAQQVWRQWNFGIPAGATINGIETQIIAELIAADPAAGTNCTLGVQISPNGGTNWYPTTALTTPGLTVVDDIYTAWRRPTRTRVSGPGRHGHLGAGGLRRRHTGFQVRVTWNRGSCAATETAKIDVLNVRVTYTATTTTTTNNLLGAPNSPCPNGVAGCYLPDGSSLNARGFWADMGTQGTSNVNGDAYQSFYDTATSKAAKTCPSGNQACYDPTNYYNYAVNMPPGSTNGYVYVFDPVFLRRRRRIRDQRSLAERCESRQLVVRPVQHARHPL